MPSRDIVVVGASAGGVAALSTLARDLPAGFAACVLVVLHVGNNRSILPELLSSVGKLPARHAEDEDRIVPGRILVAPPDRHLVVDGDVVRLKRSAKENFTRPALDPLFRSAAVSLGSRTVGVILSGRLDDGVAGLQAIKSCGGLAIVQDPEEAEASEMPANALASVDVDHCLPVRDIARLLGAIMQEEVTESSPVEQERWRRENAAHELREAEDPMAKLASFAAPSTLTCPECSGTLWEVQGSRPARFRCHTGHAFTLRTLLDASRDQTENAMSSAIRAMQERHALLLLAARLAREHGLDAEALVHEAEADRLMRQIDLVRSVLERGSVEAR